MWSKIKNINRKIMSKNGFFVAVLVLLISLLMRNPFGERTLIPNLEPYPDTLHYIVPARSLASAGPFKLTRGYGEIDSNVAPLYSLMLVPFYVMNSDPRMFYLLNVLLSLASFYLFYKLIGVFVKNKWIIGITLFLYVTNYYIYWYPQWAMAENLTLTLFIGSLYLLTRKVNFKNIVIAALVAVSFYATKYAYPLMTLTYFSIYVLKIFKDGKAKNNKQRYLRLGKFIVIFSALQILIFSYQYHQTGSSPLHSLVYVSKGISGNSANDSGSWFSSEYFSQNFKIYMNAISGGSQRFLWNYKPLYPKWTAYLSVMGILVNLFRKKTSFFTASTLTILMATVILLSFFYTADIRYIYQVIPVIYIGLGMFLGQLLKFLMTKNLSLVFWLFSIFLCLYYLSGNGLRVKDQIVLNLKYAEVPWYYKSVLVLNDFFDDKYQEDKDVYVITSMIPYYIDLYSNGNYKLLPLSSQQDFRKDREKIWGPGNYENLIALYEDKIDNGDQVYVYTYGLGNEGYLHAAFEDVRENFDLTQVVNECYSQCVLYELKNEQS